MADEDDTLSVGASGAERRIVNVADGMSASDAATVGQLNAAIMSVTTGGSLPYIAVNSTGLFASASGSDAVAIGEASSATADNSVALCAGSVADEADTVSIGAIGSERRVTNVADGVHKQDAATIGQLNALEADVITNANDIVALADQNTSQDNLIAANTAAADAAQRDATQALADAAEAQDTADAARNDASQALADASDAQDAAVGAQAQQTLTPPSSPTSR